MREIKSLLVAFFVFTFFYLIGSFYSADFNIKNWTELTRFAISFFGAMFCVASFLVFYFKDKI